MDSFDWLAEWLYSNGDVLFMMSKLTAMLFVIEMFCYLVSILSHAAKTAIK